MDTMTYIEVAYTGLEGNDWIYRHGGLECMLECMLLGYSSQHPDNVII